MTTTKKKSIKKTLLVDELNVQDETSQGVPVKQLILIPLKKEEPTKTRQVKSLLPWNFENDLSTFYRKM